MSDQQRREHERRASQGDVQAQAKVLLDRLRQGDLRRSQLELAAYLRDAAATDALGAEAPAVPDLLDDWVVGLQTYDGALPLRAGLAVAHALAPTFDSSAIQAQLDRLDAWLACPCRIHALEALELCNEGPSLAIQQLVRGMDSTSPRLRPCIRVATQRLGAEGLCAVVREALVPWALRPAATLVPRHFQEISATLVHDDITQRRVDVIANAANDQLLMQGGVAAALRAAGGEEIEREAAAHAPAPLGSVVQTGAGRLFAQQIYHAVVIRYSLVGGTRSPDVRVAVREITEQARGQHFSQVALPLFGAGVGGLKVSKSVETILDALESATGSGRCSRLHVEVVVRDAEEFAEAARAWVAYQPAGLRAEEADREAEHYLRLLERGEAGIDRPG